MVPMVAVVLAAVRRPVIRTSAPEVPLPAPGQLRQAPTANEIAATRANRPRVPSVALRKVSVFHCSIDGNAVAASATPITAARMPVSPIDRERNRSRVPQVVRGGCRP